MRIALTNTGTPDKLELVTTGTGQVDYAVTQLDKAIADTNPTSLKTVPNVGQVTTATTTKISVDPAASHEAIVDSVSLVNTHATAAVTVALQQTLGAGTARKVTSVYTLLAGEKLEINADGTLFLYDAAGGVKSAIAAAMTRTVISAVGSGTYNLPAGCRAIDVLVIGGGGGSAGVGTGSSTATISGGGGSGAYARKLISPPAASYAYTIGAAGTAGASTPTAGGNGGQSSFGTLTAPGGQGGPLGPAAGTTDVTASGGLGGSVGTNGDYNGSGSMGFPGHRASGTTGVSGGGGDSIIGGGGNGRNTAGVGSVGDPATGGGGGGSFATSTAQAGAAGSAGVIIITEYY